MDKYTLQCPHCGQDSFPNAGALTQHQQRFAPCRNAMLESLGVDHGYTTASEFLPMGTINPGHLGSNNNNNMDNDDEDLDDEEDESGLHQDPPAINAGMPVRPVLRIQEPEDQDEDQDEADYGAYWTAHEDASDLADDEEDEDSDDEEEDDEANLDPDGAQNGDEMTLARDEYLLSVYHSVQEDFNKYLDKSRGFRPFTAVEQRAINLMFVLRSKGRTSLDTYELVMEWHLQSLGLLSEHQNVTNSPHFISRKRLFKLLRARYNMDSGYNKVSKIILPSTKTLAKVVHNSAQKAILSLLTDPRIKDEDYLFYNPDDPFEQVPADLDYIGDVNTSDARLKTAQKLITKPNQLLVEVILYCDAAATGQFAHLPITAVKFTLGIFNQQARDKGHFWRTLGYIPKPMEAKSRGKRILVESGHTEGTNHYLQLVRNEGQIGTNDVPKAQDYHTMLASILESLVDLQDASFCFDFTYKGRTYKNTEIVLYVPFFKVDTEEADKLCGKYLSRGKNVAQLCRYCTCPTAQCDDPLDNSPLKTEAKIQRLIEKGDLDALKAMSQHCIENACYDLRFGSHNAMGVHGACPMEMLHQLLLGLFKYIRDCFFDQCGAESKLAKEVDALAREYGELLSRQSDRNMPKSKFNNGIRKGKLMAKEYTGVLLCILAVLRSAKGRKLLSTKKKKHFGDPDVYRDWVMLLETCLQWEEWLKSPTLSRNSVHRAKKKFRYIMFLFKKIGKRTKGMSFKTTKFHGILHIAQDILNFGVPIVVDTGSNESHHKPTKNAAMLTQRSYDTFDYQTAQRLDEIHLLDLAQEELDGRPLWEYPEGYIHDVQMDPPVSPPAIGGAVLKCYHDPQRGLNVAQMARKIKGKVASQRLEQDLIDFVVDLQDKVKDYMDEVPLYSSHKREGQIFRGTHSYLGLPWRDWVLIDWGRDGVLPSKIWGFVDLTSLPPKTGLKHGGLSNIKPGQYAIVESSAYRWGPDDEDRADSEIMQSILTEVEGMTNGYVTQLRFYLADVEAFQDPCTVLPDIGGANNAYLLVAGRAAWKEDFEAWIRSPHKYDVIEVEEEDTEGDDDAESEVDEAQIDNNDDESEEEEEEEEDEEDNIVTDDSDNSDDSDDESNPFSS